MLNFIIRHPISTLTALILHVFILAGFAYSSFSKPEVLKVTLQGDDSQPIQAKIQQSEPMKTFAVDGQTVQRQLAMLKQKEAQKLAEQRQLVQKTQDEKKRLAQLKRQQKAEKQRADNERKKAQAEKRKAEAAQRQAAEAKRLAKQAEQKVTAQKQQVLEEKRKARLAREEALLAEKKRAEASRNAAEAKRQRALEEEKKKHLLAEIEQKSAQKKQLEKEALAAKMQQELQAEEAALQRQLDKEEAQQRAELKQREMKSLKETYVSSISAKVKDNWRTAAKVSPKAQCELDIIQTEQGNITSVKVLNCNKDASAQFKKDAEKAVYRSQPLPAPPVEELFERHIQFIFKP